MIDQTKVLTALSQMMGKRGTIPGGNTDDWKLYIQTAFDYAWRYYQWDWALRYATIDMNTAPYLPADFDIGGYREAIGTTTYEWSEVKLADYARLPSGMKAFALQFDPINGRYNIMTSSGVGSIPFVYQAAPPTLTTDTSVPFPSAMTVAIGASIYAKQGENPTRADIDQEWDQFHAELNRHVGRVDSNVPMNTSRNIQDAFHTYTGDVG